MAERKIENDEPVSSIKEDKFSFKYQAWRISKLVAGEQSFSHISVGISGEWGSGKSSLLKMIQEILLSSDVLIDSGLDDYPINQKKPIVIWFDPWFFGSESEIIKTFFVKLAKELFKQDHPQKHKLANLFISLGKWIEPLSDVFESLEVGIGPIKTNAGKIFKNIKNGTDKLVEKIEKQTFDDFFDLKEQISQILNSGKSKRIIILIDDLDRLQKDEVMTMLKIIRLITEFNNINVISALDMDAISSLISENYGYDGKSYINKMINFPTSVPAINKVDIESVYRPDIEKKLIGCSNEVLSKQTITEVVDIVFDSFDNYRKAKLFMNLFYSGFSSMDKIIDAFDYFCLCALFIFDIEYYNELKNCAKIQGGRFEVVKHDSVQADFFNPYVDEHIITRVTYIPKGKKGLSILAYRISQGLFLNKEDLKKYIGKSQLFSKRLMMYANYKHYFNLSPNYDYFKES